jgi:NitT/TauT family transport system substrate-binding protein
MKRMVSYMLTVALLAVTAGVTGCRARKPARVLRIGTQDNAFSALVLAAEGGGFFEEEGLDVTIAKYPSGKLAFKAALAGEVDMATVADMPVMVNSFTRDDFRLLCTLGYTDNGAWLIARRDRGIAKATDLVGKTVGTQEGSAVHFFLGSLLVHHRIPPDKVNVVFMPAVELVTALIEGTIDAFSMRNPFIAQAKEALGDNAIEIFEPHAYRQFFILASRRDLLDRDPSIARDALTALVKAEAFAAEAPAEAQAVVARQLGDGRETEVANDWSKYTFEIALGQDLIRGLEDQARWAIEAGRTSASEVPDFRTVIAPAAIKAVRPESFTVME